VALLQVGDIFELESGHHVYMKLPLHFVYGNRKGRFDELTIAVVTVGKSKGGMETDWLIGQYVVSKTALCGGDPNNHRDPFPHGNYVEAVQLDKDGYDNGISVFFYQTGNFTAMIPENEVHVVGRARPHWARIENEN
jgi:hypothetical protein